VGSDLPIHIVRLTPPSFNPRSRVGSDTASGRCRLWTTCFNPRSRVGSDVCIWGYYFAHIVSIHAPAWGATLHSTCRCVRYYVSIHAPAWGATHVYAFARVCCGVSIHAPAWGATHCVSPPTHSHLRFNPRSRVGSDPVSMFHPLVPVGFNPRSRVGSDVYIVVRCIFLWVSIHAPAWGATRAGYCVKFNR